MTYLLRNAVLLDANRLNEPLDVLVEDRTIRAVGKDLGPADRELDLTGYTLLPAFIDAHVHVAVDDHEFKDNAIRAWAYNGVSTVRELGMLSQLDQADYAAWIAQVNQNPENARVVAVGNYIDVAGGYGAGPMPNHPVGTLITTPEEAADEVTVHHKLGYPGIKIGIHDSRMDTSPHLSPEMAKAICDRAREHGMWVASHIGICRGAQFMLEAGVREMAHTPSDPMSDDMIRFMVENGVVMDTTVGDPDKPMGPPPNPSGADSVGRGRARERSQFSAEPETEISGLCEDDMEPPPGMDLPGGPGGPGEPPMGPPPGMVMPSPEEKRRQWNTMVENLGRYHKAGGRVVIGTDLIHSRDFQKDAVIPVPELKALTGAGFTLQEAIASGTITAAEVVGTGSEEGLIEPGRLANLIAVPGPVDESFSALNRENVKLVMHYGAIIRNEL